MGEVMRSDLWLQIRLIIELPVAEVGKRRGCAATETEAIGGGAMRFGGDG